jgi:hypothetical protein
MQTAEDKLLDMIRGFIRENDHKKKIEAEMLTDQYRRSSMRRNKNQTIKRAARRLYR